MARTVDQVTGPALGDQRYSSSSQANDLAPDQAGGSTTAVQQYSLAQILGVWAAAALPMGLLAWVGAPLLSDQLSGLEPLGQALLILLTVGLIWQFVLVMFLVYREQGSLAWSRLREALWLRAPRNPRNGRSGGRVWWWVLPFILIFGLKEIVPGFTGPVPRDFGEFMRTGGGEAFFSGAWGWFGVIVVMAIFNTVLGEELLFRGLLLPRMRGVFGKNDWVANGLLFTAYHLHVPWMMPSILLDTFALAYPSRRFQSAWMGIIVHSTQSIFITLAVLGAVLA